MFHGIHAMVDWQQLWLMVLKNCNEGSTTYRLPCLMVIVLWSIGEIIEASQNNWCDHFPLLLSTSNPMEHFGHNENLWILCPFIWLVQQSSAREGSYPREENCSAINSQRWFKIVVQYSITNLAYMILSS